MPPGSILQKPAFALDDPKNPPDQAHNQADCDKYETLLTQLNLPGEFYGIHCLSTRRTRTLNLDGKLGYRDSPFDLLTSNIHPLLLSWYEAYIQAAMLILPSYSANFLGGRFVIRFPLKHNVFDKFYLVTQSIGPFQMDRSGNVLSFFSHFHISGEYWWEPLCPEIIGFDPYNPQAILNALLIQINSWISLTEKQNLTPGHFVITDATHTLYQAGKTADHKAIAEYLAPSGIGRLSTDTVHRYLNEIKGRLRWILKNVGPPITFPCPILDSANAVTVINFCKAMGILDLLKLNNHRS